MKKRLIRRFSIGFLFTNDFFTSFWAVGSKSAVSLYQFSLASSWTSRVPSDNCPLYRSFNSNTITNSHNKYWGFVLLFTFSFFILLLAFSLMFNKIENIFSLFVQWHSQFRSLIALFLLLIHWVSSLDITKNLPVSSVFSIFVNHFLVLSMSFS